jgi:hypothetical protein
MDINSERSDGAKSVDPIRTLARLIALTCLLSIGSKSVGAGPVRSSQKTAPLLKSNSRKKIKSPRHLNPIAWSGRDSLNKAVRSFERAGFIFQESDRIPGIRKFQGAAPAKGDNAPLVEIIGSSHQLSEIAVGVPKIKYSGSIVASLKKTARFILPEWKESDPWIERNYYLLLKNAKKRRAMRTKNAEVTMSVDPVMNCIVLDVIGDKK